MNHQMFNDVKAWIRKINATENLEPWYFKTPQRQMIKYFLTPGGVSTCNWILH